MTIKKMTIFHLIALLIVGFVSPDTQATPPKAQPDIEEEGNKMHGGFIVELRKKSTTEETLIGIIAQKNHRPQVAFSSISPMNKRFLQAFITGLEEEKHRTGNSKHKTKQVQRFISRFIGSGSSMHDAYQSILSGKGYTPTTPLFYHSTSPNLAPVDDTHPRYLNLSDIYPKFPTHILQQGDVGDCTAAATTTAFRIRAATQGLSDGFAPEDASLFFNYAISRIMMAAQQAGISVEKIMGTDNVALMNSALKADSGSTGGFSVLAMMEKDADITDLPTNSVFSNGTPLYTLDGIPITGKGFGSATDAAWSTPDTSFYVGTSENFSAQPDILALASGAKNQVSAAKFLGASSDTDPKNEKLSSGIITELRAGHPITMGIEIFTEWDDTQTPVITSGSSSAGGHEITIIGATADYFIVQNSWGRAMWESARDHITLPTFPLDSAPADHDITIHTFFPASRHVQATPFSAINAGDVLEIKGPKRSFSSETGAEVWTPAPSLILPSGELLTGESLLKITAPQDMTAGYYLYGIFPRYGGIAFVHGSDVKNGLRALKRGSPFHEEFSKLNRGYTVLSTIGDNASGIFYLPKDYPGIQSAISIQEVKITP